MAVRRRRQRRRPKRALGRAAPVVTVATGLAKAETGALPGLKESLLPPARQKRAAARCRAGPPWGLPIQIGGVWQRLGECPLLRP